jgi:hypothetical protein
MRGGAGGAQALKPLEIVAILLLAISPACDTEPVSGASRAVSPLDLAETGTSNP